MQEYTTLSNEDIEYFNIHGAVVLRGLFKDWVEPLRVGLEKNLSCPGPFVRDYNDETSGRFFGDYCNWNRIDEYKDFLFNSQAAHIASQLMHSATARLFHEHVLIKETHTQIPTPWHHDQPYYCVNGKQNCSLWLALDSVSRDTAVEFISGSHKWGKWFRPERFDNSPLYENDHFEPLPDINNHREDYEIIGWDTQPGDVVAFHFLTLHGSPGNQSQISRRRAFSSRWVGDDATFAVRQGKTSPPFTDCTLKHGEPLDGADFPLIKSV